MSDEQTVNPEVQALQQDSVPANAPGESAAAVSHSSESRPEGASPQRSESPAPQWRISDDAALSAAGASAPAGDQDPLEVHQVPINHLFEARNKAREAEARASEYEQRIQQMEAELKQWNELSPRLQERLSQADQYEQQVQVYERQLQEAMNTMKKEEIDWQPPDVASELQKDRALQTLLSTVSELKTQLPSLIDQGISNRERAYQEAQAQREMQNRRMTFEQELESKMARLPLPLQTRDMHRQMILSHAASNKFATSVDDYLRTLTFAPPPPPPPQQRAGNGPPQQIPPGRREPAQTALGDWEGKTWDDFGGDPWDVKL